MTMPRAAAALLFAAAPAWADPQLLGICSVIEEASCTSGTS